METIYDEACRAASNRPVPEQAQLKIWRQVMCGFDPADLRGGLAIWWRTEQYLPMPAQLKPLAEQARRARIAKNTGPKDEVLWQCPDCGVTMTGFIDPADDRPRICRGTARNGPQHDAAGNSIPCGAVMNEIQRDKAS
jgi:hypothetical protein